MTTADLENLRAFLLAETDGDLVPWSAQQRLMELFDLDCYESEMHIMQNSLLPARYQRNRKMLSIANQQQLLNANVAVIGCGGLGGYVIEELGRLGVGQLLVVDPDVFEEHNLNRQLLSSVDNLGSAKVEAAVGRVAGINPAVRVTPKQVAFTKHNGLALLDGVDIVVDAIDNIAGRLDLAEICAALGIPLVHAAIGGWYGQVTTVYPGDETLQRLYANWTEGKGIEAALGNPSFTPAVAASLQVAEVCKFLTRTGQTLRRKMLSIDLHEMQYEQIPL